MSRTTPYQLMQKGFLARAAKGAKKIRVPQDGSFPGTADDRFSAAERWAAGRTSIFTFAHFATFAIPPLLEAGP